MAQDDNADSVWQSLPFSALSSGRGGGAGLRRLDLNAFLCSQSPFHSYSPRWQKVKEHSAGVSKQLFPPVTQRATTMPGWDWRDTSSIDICVCMDFTGCRSFLSYSSVLITTQTGEEPELVQCSYIVYWCFVVYPSVLYGQQHTGQGYLSTKPPGDAGFPTGNTFVLWSLVCDLWTSSSWCFHSEVIWSRGQSTLGQLAKKTDNWQKHWILKQVWLERSNASNITCSHVMI